MSANETHEEELGSGSHYYGLVAGCAKCAAQTKELTAEHQAGLEAGRSHDAHNVHLGRYNGMRPQCPLCIAEHERYSDRIEADYWNAKSAEYLAKKRS